MRWWSAIVALVAVSGVSATAQASAWHVDAGGATLVEAWDRNESGEALAGVVLGADRRIWRGIAVRTEAQATHIEQAGQDAWLGGWTIGTRGRWAQSFVHPFVESAFGCAQRSADT